MRSMQSKITDELAAIAAGLGLELVHASGRASNTGRLYYQDGLVTHLTAGYNFQSDQFTLTLTGPAVDRAAQGDAPRQLGPGIFRPGPRPQAVFYTENTNGARITGALDFIRTALAPYAPKPAAGKAATR